MLVFFFCMGIQASLLETDAALDRQLVIGFTPDGAVAQVWHGPGSVQVTSEESRVSSALGATHFLAPRKRGWPLPSPAITPWVPRNRCHPGARDNPSRAGRSRPVSRVFGSHRLGWSFLCDWNRILKEYGLPSTRSGGG